MSGLGLVVATWAPVILRSLPQIIKVVQDLYALWCGMRGTRQENDAVLRAMKLLNRHQDDIDRLLQDPEQKRDLLEGLTILMNRINQHDGSQARAYENNMGASSTPFSNGACGPSSSFGSFSKSSMKGGSWKMCEVCQSEYNSSDKRPTILICGHTFCRECLGEILHRGPLLCPNCRTHESRRLSTLPPNTGLIRVLDEGDDSCGGGGCDGISLSYEQQIEYAIFLSQQQAENQGASYVETRWREVEEAEDERLARALQDSEIFEASRACFERHWAEGANGALDPPDKEKEEACGASALPTPEEEEASLHLAIELQQKEMAMLQKLSAGYSNASDSNQGWMQEYQSLFGASLCGPVEEISNTSQEERNAEDTREEQQDQEDGASAICCSRREDEWRKDDRDDCGKKCYEDDCGRRCSDDEDDCLKKKSSEKCVAFLKEEEELLIEMAIRLSLEQDGEQPSMPKDK